MPRLLFPHVITFPSRWGTSAASAAKAGSGKFLALLAPLFFTVSILHQQEVTQLVTQVSITGVAKLTIWGPTFTLIGPKVFGKILVGELVLETGNVIIEILPKKKQ